MSRYGTKPLGGAKKILEMDRFTGLDIGKLQCGQLTDVGNMHILTGGALRSLLEEKKITVTPSPAIAGVYTYSSSYDPRYETKTTAAWVYQNVCPADVLNYASGLTSTSRIMVADVGKPGKTEAGYRNVLAAFSDGEKTYILYDAVYNIIDQRRDEEYSAVGTGILVQYVSTYDETLGLWAIAYTLTQLWLDTIDASGRITSVLVTGYLKRRKKYSDNYAKATLISTDGENFRYASAEWLPTLGVVYSASPDAIYENYYATLGTAHTAVSYLAVKNRRLVRYSNRTAGEGVYGETGEKLLLLPEMQLLTNSGGTWGAATPSETIPQMDAAVQHFERLYGISGDRLYVSAAGNCTDYTEAVDGLPVTAAWQTVTADVGGFTAIASFDGQVVVFTAYSMMTVRGIELPFSLSYIGAYGCPSAEAVTVLGDWLYFSSGSAILRYNGSRVENIGTGLAPNYTFSAAKLTAAEGLVAVSFPEFAGLYFYDPQSESWSCRHSAAADFPDGCGGLLLRTADGGTLPYRIFAEAGDFSAAVSLGCGERRCIRAISVTAFLASGAVLRLSDDAGNCWLTVNGEGRIVTRTAAIRGLYTDCADLLLSGSGDVTLYCVRVQYTPIGNRLRHIE